MITFSWLRQTLAGVVPARGGAAKRKGALDVLHRIDCKAARSKNLLVRARARAPPISLPTEGDGKVCVQFERGPTKCGKDEVSMIGEGGATQLHGMPASASAGCGLPR